MRNFTHLQKKKVADKNGVIRTVWVRVEQKPKAQQKQAGGTDIERLRKEATEIIGVHKKTFKGTLRDLEKAFPGANVYGRVKDIESAAQKILRKPHYKSPKNLQDLSGFRVERETIGDVKKDIAEIKRKFKVIDEDDYINNPNGDYRSFHVIIEDKTGKQFEVQLRTKNQTVWADWYHDIYKPRTAEQRKTIEKEKTTIVNYGHKMAEYFYAKDTGKQPPPKSPPCTRVIQQTFGCIS